MKCAIMQPTYLPWLGYFDLIRSVDVFVILDHVQFEKRSWQQRNRILTKNGVLYLTVPVITKSKFFQPISTVEIDQTQKFQSKHMGSILNAYSKKSNTHLLADIEKIFDKKQTLLADLNMDFIRWGMELMGLNARIARSSELAVEGNKVEALIDICKKVGCDQYLSPLGSAGYIEENNLFGQMGIELTYQNYDHPTYDQGHEPFESHLSFIDYIFSGDFKPGK